MSPSAWVRNNPGVATSLIVALLSEALAIVLPVANTKMLDNENVVQILGVIVAGQLAVLALTVPALLEVRSTVMETEYSSALLDTIDRLSKELRSNTLSSFVMFGIAFAVSTVLEGVPSLLSAKIAGGPDVNTLFAGVKITLVALSLLAMWDSVEPLFGLGEAMTLLHKDMERREAAQRARSQQGMAPPSAPREMNDAV